MVIDLNCDMGESFGAYALGADEALMPLITSANIACGYHAGDPMVMDRTVRLALRYGVGIGAHPGFPDLMGFGRRAMHLRPAEVENNYVLCQVGALAAFARSVGAELTHVKPHGALYHMAAHDPEIARSVARGVARAGPRLILVGLAGSALIQAAAEGGLPAAREGFADRAYEPDGQPLVMNGQSPDNGRIPENRDGRHSGPPSAGPVCAGRKPRPVPGSGRL